MATLIHDHMQLSIAQPAGGSADYVQISGDVDIRNARALGLAARELIEAGADVIYVDLAGVRFMGSALVGFLLQIGTAAAASGRAMVLCRPTSTAGRTIQFSGLERVADLRADLPADWPAATPAEVAAP